MEAPPEPSRRTRVLAVAVPEVRALSRVPLTISAAAWVWVAFALAALLPFTRTQSVAVPAAPSRRPEELMTAAFETAHAPSFTGRFVRWVARLVTSDFVMRNAREGRQLEACPTPSGRTTIRSRSGVVACRPHSHPSD